MQPVHHWTNLVALAVLGTWITSNLMAESPARFRHPVALQLSTDERFVFVANARSGSLMVLDWRAGGVLQEKDIGKRLTALRRIPASNTLLATDDMAHELVLCEIKEFEINVCQRLPVSQYPVDVIVREDGHKAFVSSLWSHRVSAVELTKDRDNRLQIEAPQVLDLPFAPRCLLLVKSGTRLIAADAFGGRLAVIDAKQMKLLHVRAFPSHNIRGLALSPDGKMLLVAHQMLNELAHTTNNDVHWGLLMSNDLRWLPLDSILSTTADLYTGAHMHPLGHAGNATGDPSGLAIASDGTVVVTLGGIDELAMGQEKDFSFQRLGIGRRPTGVTVSSDGRHAFVANTFGDSVSIVDLKVRASIREISLGPQPPRSLADRGELLFYDARLSHDGWMSCHSCHTDGHSNGLLNDNFSDDSFGAPKRVLSLAGQMDTAPFAWNAKAESLDAQIRNSITHTMQGDEPPTERQVTALSAYVQSLTLPPSLTAARGEIPGESAARGAKLFAALQCARCHVPPTYTSTKVFDVGIHDKQGNKEFNPPSLRSVSQRGPFFHDNRAETLEAVFRDVGHQLDRNLSEDELRDLVAFLNGL
jgi:DNA-binding beta-propeller fold protein YncE